MGICIHIGISKSVKKEEWKKVYEESLQLVKAFPLAEKRNVICKGIDIICLVPTEEQEETYGWNDKKTRMGWCTVGDYETMHTAESYYLPRDLIEDNDVESDAGDALFGVLPTYMNYDGADKRFCNTYNIWGNKTQGEPYHIYLLAIACMIESRLGEKAFVYGDITSGQCRKAVELANKYLVEPIDVPDRCDMKRLWKRTSKMSFSEKEHLAVFERFFLGVKDAAFGEYIRNMFSEKACDEYWKNRFECSYIGTVGFDREIKEYLLWGFNLETLCSLVNYNDKNNNPQYEKFVKRIMDAKLHQKSKNCNDILEINQEESKPYSIYTIMAQFTFAGAMNKKVDRYIPIEEIRKALKNSLGKKCDVDWIIDEYLAKEAQEVDIKISENQMSDREWKIACEQDASEVFQQMMDIRSHVIMKLFEKYDISDYEDLMYYKKGDAILPNLKESLKKSYMFYTSLLGEDCYKELIEQPAAKRCRWLVEQNRSILVAPLSA